MMEIITRKISKFLRYEDKWKIIQDRVIMVFQQLTKYKYNCFGKGSLIEKPLRILGSKHISIGNNVSILKNARIEIVTFHNERQYDGFLKIGDNTSIGQNFHCVSGGGIYIGVDVTISGNVFISDLAHEYREIGTHILEQELLYSKTTIGRGCFVGYGAVIMPGVTLGNQCVVGSNAVVLAGDYPDYSVIVGNPARIVKKYDINSKEWIKV